MGYLKYFFCLALLTIALGCIQLDTKAPTFKDVGSNISVAFGNETVSFRASWEDETALDSYLFSWTVGNNCTAWVNTSLIKFKAEKRDVAEYRATVPEICKGKKIRWKFYARDKAGNWNSTPEFTITSVATVEEFLIAAMEMGERVEEISINYTFSLRMITKGASFSTEMDIAMYQDKSLNKSSVFVTSHFPTKTSIFYYLPNGTFRCELREKYSCVEVEEEHVELFIPQFNRTLFETLKKGGMTLEGCGTLYYANRSCECVMIDLPGALLPYLLPSLDWEDLRDVELKHFKQKLCIDREIGIVLHQEAEMLAEVPAPGESIELRVIVESSATSVSLSVDPKVFELPIPWSAVTFLPAFRIISANCIGGSNLVNLTVRARKSLDVMGASLTAKWGLSTAEGSVPISPFTAGETRTMSIYLNKALPSAEFIFLYLTVDGYEDSYWCYTGGGFYSFIQPFTAILEILPPFPFI